MLFNSGTAASDCRDYILTVGRDIKCHIIPSSVSLFAIETLSCPTHKCCDEHNQVVYVVSFPQEACTSAAAFWRLSGTGISSRQADTCLQSKLRLNPIPIEEYTIRSQTGDPHPAYEVLRLRIAALIERTLPVSPRAKKASSADIFLYQSGMSSVYYIHQLLLKWRGGETVILGFAYELTIKMMDVYGPGSHLYAFGTEEDLDQLETHLEQMRCQGRRIQAIWCECPSNPLLRTVNFHRVRELAQKHDLVVIVDETIGSFANVDVLDVADIVISSLTKYFNGYGDVLAGR